MKFFITNVILFFSVILGTAIAQSNNSIMLAEKSTMQIEGTSNVRDWTAEVEQMDFNINFNASALNSDSFSNPVDDLSLTIPVDDIESGKGGMNRKMHGALKKDDYPSVTFILTSSELVNTNTDSSFELDVIGTLTVAGVEKEINFPVEGTVQDDGTYRFTGQYETDMRDFNIDPPTAMFGTVRSEEMVTISFELFFQNG